MKKIAFFLSMVFALSALFSSCTVYHPQSVDIPLIRHQNDLQVEGAISISPYPYSSPTLNATATYSFNKWGAVQAHINTDGYTELYLQTAFGSYLPIKQHYVIEGYAGYGLWGSRKSEAYELWDSNEPEPSGIYHCPFLQFNTGWVGLAKEHIDVGFGLKTGCLISKYREISSSSYTLEGNIYQSIEFNDFINYAPLIEPQVFIRFGGKKLKGSLRVSYCTFLGMENFVYFPANISIGISYKFEFKR